MHSRTAILLMAGALGWLAAPAAAIQPGGPAPTQEVWKPAATPPGGISWALLESTKEIQRTQDGIIYSRPQFPPQVKALAGKRVKVSGYMMPLQNGERQTHFVLLAYPPGCPYHMHAGPTQLIEVKSKAPIAFNYDVLTIEGTLELGGQDERGVFYRIPDARAV